MVKKTFKKKVVDGDKLRVKLTEIQGIINFPSNLKLIEKINSYIYKTEIERWEISKGASIQELANYLSFKWWDEHPCTYCHLINMYHKQPQKVINWIGGCLNQFTPELKKMCIEIMLEMIEDKQRFEFESEGVNYIYNWLKNIDINEKHPDFINEGVKMLVYFNGQESIPAEKVIESHARMYGLLKDKKQVYKEYITENLNSAFIEAVNELNIFTKVEGVTKIPAQSKRELEPIKWQKQSILLAYLISELKNYGFINGENIWKLCEQIFVDRNGKPIKATTFTSFVKNYENNQTERDIKGSPKNSSEITQLISLLKQISKDFDKI